MTPKINTTSENKRSLINRATYYIFLIMLIWLYNAITFLRMLTFFQIAQN